MTPFTVTLYSLPACQQCKATRTILNKRNIPHAYVADTAADHAASMFVGRLGATAAPVVVVTEPSTGAVVEWWQGFRPDRIARLSE